MIVSLEVSLECDAAEDDVLLIECGVVSLEAWVD